MFNAETTPETAQPIFAHPTADVGCSETGKYQCNNICSALANGARGIGASVLCSILGHAEGITVFMFGFVKSLLPALRCT